MYVGATGFCVDDLFLFDSGLLAGKFAQVVQLGAAHFTNLVHLNVVDSRRFQREDTFYTYSSRHLAYGETLLFTMAGDFDDNAAIHLHAFLVAFNDTICYGNRVASLETGVLLAGSKCFFCNFNQIHVLCLLNCSSLQRNIPGFSLFFLTAIARKRLQRNELFARYTNVCRVFCPVALKIVPARRKAGWLRCQEKPCRTLSAGLLYS